MACIGDPRAVARNGSERAIRGRRPDERRGRSEFVFDRDSKAVAAYKAPHTSYVVVDKAGRVVYTGVGGDQDIGAAAAKAFAPTAGRDR